MASPRHGGDEAGRDPRAVPPPAAQQQRQRPRRSQAVPAFHSLASQVSKKKETEFLR